MRTRTEPRQSGFDAEDGVALFYALLVTLVVAGVIAVTFAAALTETRQSAFELDFEDAIHVAEAGAEAGLQEILEDGTTTNASDPAAHGGTEQEWAIAEASDASRTPIQVGEGETVWLRPSSGSTEYVYGVGFVPTRAAYFGGVGESFARVVRMQVAFTDAPAPGTYAFLSNRILSFGGGGSSSIHGSNGNVHSNGSFDPPASGNFTFSGTVSFHECDGDCSAPGYAETDTIVPLNVGTPEQIYSSDTARDYMNDGGDWYDYCGGQWYERTSAGGTPCGGTAVGSVPGFVAGNQASGASGVYWFQGDVDVNMTAESVIMTIITGGDINLPGGNASFDWYPAYEKMHAYAGNNVNWGNANVNAGGITCRDGLTDAERSTAASIDPGIVYAGNDLRMVGNPTAVQIAFLAENDIIFSGGGGTSRCFVLETDASGDLGGVGVPVVTEWDELH